MDDKQLSQLLTLLSEKDMTAFETLYTEMSKPLYTVLFRITKNRELAEDLLQDLFIKLYRAPLSPPPRKPRAYLFQMARNLAIDALRCQPCHSDLDDYSHLPDRSQSIPLHRMDLEQALERLNLEERQIVTLHLNAGLKFREISAILAQPLGTVLWRYRKAIQTLRTLLDGGTL